MVPAPDSDPFDCGDADFQRSDRLVKCALAIVMLATGLGGVAVWTSSTRSDAQFFAETINPDAQRYRTEKFEALRTFPLTLVGAADRANARDSVKQSRATGVAIALPPAEPLAWLTLWDSDKAGGDAVEIESGEYSRIVTLTKEGTTFAIPVSADRKIRFAGLRDDDGGGITVGVASGAAVVLLPIVHVGEVLTLNVKAE